MSSSEHAPSREEVLDAFAMEDSLDRATLSRYLLHYPGYAAELIDLSIELSREVSSNNEPLSAAELSAVDAAWHRHLAAFAAEPLDVLTDMSVETQRKVAEALGVPRQVVTSLRERRVLPNTIKRPFMRRVAATMNVSVEHLATSLAASPQQGFARAYKSNKKPVIGSQASLDQILIDAGVSPEKRAELLADED